MGGTEPGQGHYYRVQGPTFLIEFDNTQNGAKHPHAVIRSFEGDFGEDVLVNTSAKRTGSSPADERDVICGRYALRPETERRCLPPRSPSSSARSRGARGRREGGDDRQALAPRPARPARLGRWRKRGGAGLRALADEGYPVVAAVGGDGTVNAVVTGLPAPKMRRPARWEPCPAAR
ncbi:MAG: DUF3500 domain-containing protein [Verrucomicrobiales bacterium]